MASTWIKLLLSYLVMGHCLSWGRDKTWRWWMTGLRAAVSIITNFIIYCPHSSLLTSLSPTWTGQSCSVSSQSHIQTQHSKCCNLNNLRPQLRPSISSIYIKQHLNLNNYISRDWLRHHCLNRRPHPLPPRVSGNDKKSLNTTNFYFWGEKNSQISFLHWVQ